MIGPYRVLRRIGSGGMGVVHEAHDDALDRRVALKVISPHLAEDSAFRDRFRREAQAMASLDSGHVVHVYAHGESDGRLWIATQLVPDGDLGLLLETYGAPPVRVALDLMAQVASGLADAHDAGLVHRDIKPANVLLRRRDHGTHAYLSDFGIARPLGADVTRSRAGTVGTPSYMAPELHTGGQPGVASDVYSLGCLLWATVSGRAPYGGTSEYEVVSAHLEQPVPQLDGTSPLVAEVNRILRSAMAKDPAQRPGSARGLAVDLRRAQALSDEEGDGATGTVVRPAGSRPSGSGSRRTLLVAAAVALGVVVVGGAVALAAGLGGGQDDDRRVSPPVSSDGLGGGASRGTATVEPDPGGQSTGPAGKGDQARAVDSLAEALEDQGILTAAQARCTAREWVDQAGLQAMREAGFFDEDLDFVDQDQSAMTPVFELAATSAAFACVGA
jgi:serine/threonine-protein kinase